MRVRDRIMDALATNPNGLSKSELQRRAHCNPGAFRRTLERLVEAGDIQVTEEDGEWGPSKVHRLASSVSRHQMEMNA